MSTNLRSPGRSAIRQPPQNSVIARPNNWTRSISSTVQGIAEPAKIRVQRYLREQLATGRRPTIREIMETCQVAKRTAVKHRDIVFGRSSGTLQEVEEEERLLVVPRAAPSTIQ